MAANRKKMHDSGELHKVWRSGGNGRDRRPEDPGEKTSEIVRGGWRAGREAEVAELVEAVRALPDVRLDKVAAIRKAIESGTYVVDARKVAGKMLEELRMPRSAEAGSPS